MVVAEFEYADLNMHVIVARHVEVETRSTLQVIHGDKLAFEGPNSRGPLFVDRKAQPRESPQDR